MRPLVLAGVAAVVLTIVVIVALRSGGNGGDKSRDTTDPAGDPAPTEPGTRQGPVRMKAPEVTSSSTAPDRQRPQIRTSSPLSSSFEGQERDDVWANDLEREIGERIEPLLEKYRKAVSVPRVECKRNTCRVAITGTDELSFRQFVESLQDERGFYGFADQLILEKPQSSAQGMSIRVFLVFER